MNEIKRFYTINFLRRKNDDYYEFDETIIKSMKIEKIELMHYVIFNHSCFVLVDGKTNFP